MKTNEELNKIVKEKYEIEEGLWFIFNDPNLKNEFDIGLALSILLKEEIVWVNSTKDNSSNLIPLLLVNTNDIFVLADFDPSILKYNEIEPLTKLFLDNEKWGIIKWACLFNKMQPLSPIIQDMKRDGYWDNELEALPINIYDCNTICF